MIEIKAKTVDLNNVSRFQKILLITDGTVTKLLEYYLEESITVYKLNEEITHNISVFPHHSELSIDSPQNTLQRKIFLQGELTGKNWIYAESTILIDQLTSDFRRDLLESNQPIGKLWIKYRLETYKSILSTQEEKAGDLAPYFNIKADDLIISRTYSVYSNKKVIMIITEKFPRSFFQDERILTDE